MATKPRVKFKLNPRWAAEYLRSSDAQRVTRAAAERAKAAAEEAAPRSAEEHEHYADQFRIVETEGFGRYADRVSSALVNDSDHAAAVELHHKVLGRAVDAAERG